MMRGVAKDSAKESIEANPIVSCENPNGLFSPIFKSVAAMAGWDEEALIIASLVVEDTPDRDFKQKKRSDLVFKTPPSTTSRRKRRAQRHHHNHVSPPISLLNLEEEETSKEENKAVNDEEKNTEGTELTGQPTEVSCSNPALPCMDKLREELSCAICLEICFEPSTTPCGHSFCKKCLRSAADKCGKRCPKCRQLISNGRSCTINTVLWNTIQLLFPQEVEARKAAAAINCAEVAKGSPETGIPSNNRRRSIRPSNPTAAASRSDASLRRREALSRDEDDDAALALRLQREDLSRLLRAEGSGRRRRGMPSQDEDAALAFRLQREEFVESFRLSHEQDSRPTSLSRARANLRAMASRAVSVRSRGRPS